MFECPFDCGPFISLGHGQMLPRWPISPLPFAPSAHHHSRPQPPCARPPNAKSAELARRPSFPETEVSDMPILRRCPAFLWPLVRRRFPTARALRFGWVVAVGHRGGFWSTFAPLSPSRGAVAPELPSASCRARDVPCVRLWGAQSTLSWPEVGAGDQCRSTIWTLLSPTFAC